MGAQHLWAERRVGGPRRGASPLADPLFPHDHRPGSRSAPGAEHLPGGSVRRRRDADHPAVRGGVTHAKHPIGRRCGGSAGPAARGRICGLRGGRLRAGQSAGAHPAGLGPLHQCPAGAGAGIVRGGAVHPHRAAARHRDHQVRRPAVRDHYLPHRGGLYRRPPPGRGTLCAGCAAGPGPAGLYHQCHGLQRCRGAHRPLWRAAGPAAGHPAGRGRPRHPL